MKQKQQGLTLVELMIVIAVIGLLAAFALPQYVDYTQRARISGGLAGVTTYKSAIALCYQDQGRLANCDAGAQGVPAAIAAAGVVNYVDAVAVTDGVIALTTSARQSDGSAIAIQLSPNVGSDAALNWVLTGNGCQGGAGSEAGRVVNCSGS